MQKVSIIIPTYKRSDRLVTAIHSVTKQTYDNIEIIVVDDNTANDTYQRATEEKLQPFIKQQRITYIKHSKNSGGCKARNTGAKAATGEFIAFLDDDDYYEPNKLKNQVTFLEKHPELDACMCSMYREDENKNRIESRENIARGTTLKNTILDGNLFTSMLLIKKTVFDALDGFSEIPRFQDKYFHLKFLKSGYRIGILDQKLLTLVEHQEQRISSTSINKVIISLNKIHEIEKSEKSLFSKNEWKQVKLEYLYAKAFIRSQSTFFDRIKSILNTIACIPLTNKTLTLAKLILRTFIPKTLLKN